MQPYSYFDFVNECAIRVKGHRIGIEHVLGDYHDGASRAEIRLRYPTLTLEEIDATIRYYLANRHDVDQYLDRVKRQQEEDWQEQQRNPPEFVIALRKKLDRILDGESPVRVWREYRGLSIKQLATSANISAAYLSQIEGGSRNGSLSTMKALARELSLDVGDLT